MCFDFKDLQVLEQQHQIREREKGSSQPKRT